MKLKLYSVEFEPIYPIGSALILLEYNEEGAIKMASETIKHTNIFTVTEISMKKPSVVYFQDGDY